MATGKNHPTMYASRRVVWRIIMLQTQVALGLAVIFGLMTSIQSAVTALIGAGIAILPNALFALLAFRYSAGRIGSNVIRYFFIAEAVKWLSTIVLLIVAFVTLTGPWIPLLVTLFILLQVQWLAPFFLKFKFN